MRFSLPDSYFEFFCKHQILEIEDLLSEQEVDDLCRHMETVLLKKLFQKPLDLVSNQEFWKAGKDLWKEDPQIKKILFRLQLGELCHFLFKKRPIRLAYAQTFFTGKQQDLVFSKAASLSNISSASPLLGGALFCFSSTQKETTSEQPGIPSLLEIQKKRVFFFSPDYPIPFPELFQEKEMRALLLCFAAGNARYKLEPKDPHTHDLKKEGYVFGDSLKEETCPYLYR